MANLLAIGLTALLTSRGGARQNRTALAGFEAWGVAALLMFLGLSCLATHPIHEGVGRLMRAIGLVPGPVFLAGAVVVPLLPQLALALLGGWLGGS